MLNRMALTLVFLGTVVAGPTAENWPQWRGPQLNGISGEKDLPVHWSRTANITWKLALPSWSGSTPVVWGDRIFLHVADGNDLYLWCVDRTRGVSLWKQRLGGGNARMMKQNMSSPSPVTDGLDVWAMTGTGILKAFDFTGKELWARDIQKDYGRFGMMHGYASSPLLYEDALYLQVLHGAGAGNPSYVLRVDKATGKTVWRTNRPTQARFESPDAYTTPALLRYGTSTEIVVTGGDVVTGYDPATGKELWRVNGLNPSNDGDYRIVASPVVYGDVIIAPSRERPMLALKAGGQARDDQPALVVGQRARRADAGHGRDLPVRRERPRDHVVPRSEDGEGRLQQTARALGNIQRIAGPRRREDLRHERRWRHRGRESRTGFSGPGGERPGRLHAQLTGNL